MLNILNLFMCMLIIIFLVWLFSVNFSSLLSYSSSKLYNSFQSSHSSFVNLFTIKNSLKW